MPFRLVAAVVVVASLAAILHARVELADPRPADPPQSGASRPTALLMGAVIDPLDNRPVAGAQVALGGAPQSVTTAAVLTDAEGRFVFLDLPKGTYTIVATKAGYADGALGRRRPEGPGQSVTLADDERVGDLTIPIWKFAAITGTIRDEAGEPMVDVAVRVLRRTVVAGRRKLTPGAIARTDDRGIFRFGSLVPGEYIVAVPSTQATAPESIVDLYRQVRAAGPGPGPDLRRDFSFSGASDVLNLFAQARTATVDGLAFMPTSGTMRGGVSPLPGSDGRIFLYPTQYHAAAATIAEAAPLTVRSGEERVGADVRLKLVPGVRVSGTVTGPDGPLITVMTLEPATEDLSTDASMETAITLSDSAGRFTFLGVPAGQYRLRAMRVEVPASGTGSRGGAPPPAREQISQPLPPAPSQPGYTLSVTQPLAVGSTSIDNLAVTVRPGFRVSGRAQFANATKPVDPALIRRMSATFDPADARPLVSSTIGRGQFEENGTLWSYQMPPGRYYVRINGAPPGWTLKTALWNGQDISNTPVRLDRDVSGVTIVFTDRPATLSGQVRTASGAPDPTATVLIFPADSGTWTDYGDFPRRLRAVRVARDGTYESAGLSPGDYLVVAVVDESTTNWQDPITLKALARVATAVRVGEDETRTLTLTTAAVSR